MWQNILMQMLFGGMVGYITNDFALEMLFEKRLGLGGVIPKTREQFVNNISEMVERDIITQAIIKEEIEKPEFDQSISKATRDFFDRSLRTEIPDVSLEKSPGFEQIAENLASYADKKMDDFVEQIAAVLDTHVQFEELAGEDQRRFATEHFFDEMLYRLEDGQTLEELVMEIAADIKENRLQDLLDWILIFVSRNRGELENMVGRSIMGGLSKMGPMMAMLAGGLAAVSGPIPAEVVNFVADRERLERLLNEKLDEIARGESSLPGEMKLSVLKMLRDERDTLLEKAQGSIAQALETLTAHDILEAFELKAVLRRLARPEALRGLAQGINLHELYEAFIGKTEVARRMKENTAGRVNGFIKENAGRMLSGRIKQFVRNNLDRYDESQIKESARGFIGRNLKPITYFGAFLGVLTGFILSFAVPAAASAIGGAAQSGGLSAGINGIWPVLIYMLAYGILGWATNWIAILMLFRPYRPYRMIPLFSPGYIMKNKPAFAASLGAFIETEVLSGKIISAWFAGGKDTLRTRIQEKMSANRCEMIRNTLTDKEDDLTDSIVDWEIKWMRENKEVIADRLTGMVNKVDLGGLVDQNQNKIAGRLYEELRREANARAVGRAVETMLDKLVQRALQELSKPGNTEKLAGYIHENVPALSSIPFISPAMIKQILAQVLDTLITEELPGFWASRSREAGEALTGQLDETLIRLCLKYAGKELDGQKAGKYLLDGETRKGITLQFARMTESEAFWQSESKSLGMLLSDIAEHDTFMLGEVFLTHVFSVTADGIIQTMERSIGDVLCSVNFAQITKEQVLKLEGRQIHRMFDSFMHRYFISIRRYGLIGAAFGINTIVSLVLIFAYWIGQLRMRFRSSARHKR